MSAEIILPAEETVRDEDIKNPSPEIQNFSFVRVELDVDFLARLMSQEGLSEQEIGQLKLCFRDAYIADRDLNGAIIGGIAEDGTGKIEVYCSLQVNPSRSFLTMVPLKLETIARTLAHELKHYIQTCQGKEMANTYAMKRDEHNADPREQEADEFTEQVMPEMMEHITVKEYANGPHRVALTETMVSMLSSEDGHSAIPFLDLQRIEGPIVEDREIGDTVVRNELPNPTGYACEHAIEMMSDNLTVVLLNHVDALSQRLERILNKRAQNPTARLESEEVDDLPSAISKIQSLGQKLVTDRQIGEYELKFIESRLQTKVQEVLGIYDLK